MPSDSGRQVIWRDVDGEQTLLINTADPPSAAHECHVCPKGCKFPCTGSRLDTGNN